MRDLLILLMKPANTEPLNITTILTNPTLKSIVRESPLDRTNNLEKENMFIETIIDFYNYSNFTYFFNGRDFTFDQFVIFSIETATCKENKVTYSLDSEFTRVSSESAINVYCSRINPTYKFVISLVQEDTNRENPIILYLKKNPSKGVKVSFILPGPTNETIVRYLRNTLEDIKENMMPFNQLVENDIYEHIGFIEDIRNAKVRNFAQKEKADRQSDQFGAASVKLYEVVEKIKEVCYVSEGVKLKIIDYLYAQFQSIQLLPSFFRQFQTINEFSCEMKTFLKRKICIGIGKLNISLLHREKILQVFFKEIDGYENSTLDLFSFIIDSLENKTIEASRYMSHETNVFKLNFATNSLDIVIGVREQTLRKKTAKSVRFNLDIDLKNNKEQKEETVVEKKSIQEIKTNNTKGFQINQNFAGSSNSATKENIQSNLYIEESLKSKNESNLTSEKEPSFVTKSMLYIKTQRDTAPNLLIKDTVTTSTKLRNVIKNPTSALTKTISEMKTIATPGIETVAVLKLQIKPETNDHRQNHKEESVFKGARVETLSTLLSNSERNCELETLKKAQSGLEMVNKSLSELKKSNSSETGRTKQTPTISGNGIETESIYGNQIITEAKTVMVIVTDEPCKTKMEEVSDKQTEYIISTATEVVRDSKTEIKVLREDESVVDSHAYRNMEKVQETIPKKDSNDLKHNKYSERGKIRKKRAKRKRNRAAKLQSNNEPIDSTNGDKERITAARSNSVVGDKIDAIFELKQKTEDEDVTISKFYEKSRTVIEKLTEVNDVIQTHSNPGFVRLFDIRSENSIISKIKTNTDLRGKKTAINIRTLTESNVKKQIALPNCKIENGKNETQPKLKTQTHITSDKFTGSAAQAEIQASLVPETFTAQAEIQTSLVAETFTAQAEIQTSLVAETFTAQAEIQTSLVAEEYTEIKFDTNTSPCIESLIAPEVVNNDSSKYSLATLPEEGNQVCFNEEHSKTSLPETTSLSKREKIFPFKEESNKLSVLKRNRKSNTASKKYIENNLESVIESTLESESETKTNFANIQNTDSDKQTDANMRAETGEEYRPRVNINPVNAIEELSDPNIDKTMDKATINNIEFSLEETALKSPELRTDLKMNKNTYNLTTDTALSEASGQDQSNTKKVMDAGPVEREGEKAGKYQNPFLKKNYYIEENKSFIEKTERLPSIENKPNIISAKGLKTHSRQSNKILKRKYQTTPRINEIQKNAEKRIDDTHTETDMIFFERLQHICGVISRLLFIIAIFLFFMLY
ncbi:hypothetical protein CDIK_3005 [Cucumispora dikerogammari]|nr:hypothetical protein CDIK_3005 [Cucumispora dikerogammari]